MHKTDEILNGVNIFLASATERITPNIVLIFAMINGFFLGFLTTGYLGERSMGVWSLPFWFFIEQFIVFCIFSSRYVTLTTSYLNKFALVAAIGFGLQWQIFGYYAVNYAPEIKTIEPLVDNGFASFMMAWGAFLLLGHCFKDNRVKHELKINTDIS